MLVCREETDADLDLLDGFELRVEGRPAGLPVQPQRVLAFLAVRGRRQPRTVLAEQLWMDTSSERACANLRTALWRIHRVAGTVVECSRSAVWLHDRVRVDLDTMLASARLLLDRSAAVVPAGWAADAFRADLLPAWDEDWVQIERERIHQVRLHALERLCVLLADLGRYAEAIEAGQLAVGAEPLRESAYVALIAAYLAEGNRVEARRQFQRCREILHDELGVEPSEATRATLAGGVR